uniref:Uncharacterized protein n=1 Tax=Oryza rufipogon TaxID=4529 RepID=A0A0E0Q189_ORYRU
MEASCLVPQNKGSRAGVTSTREQHRARNINSAGGPDWQAETSASSSSGRSDGLRTGDKQWPRRAAGEGLTTASSDLALIERRERQRHRHRWQRPRCAAAWASGKQRWHM